MLVKKWRKARLRFNSRKRSTNRIPHGLLQIRPLANIVAIVAIKCIIVSIASCKSRLMGVVVLVWVSKRMLKISAVIVLALLFAPVGFASASTPAKLFHWSNPMQISRHGIRDPAVIRWKHAYYLVYTMWTFSGRNPRWIDRPHQGGSPGIRLYKSTDLKHWKPVGWLVRNSALPRNCPYKDRFWAPHITPYRGKFYLTFTADNWLAKKYNPAGTWGTAGWAFIGVANKITGPYRHITWLKGGTCDLNLLPTRHKLYAIYPAYNIYEQQIDVRHLNHGIVHLVGPRKLIVKAHNPALCRGPYGKPHYLEGCWPMKIGSHYYCFFAITYSKAYKTGVLYANHPTGPWTIDPRGAIFWGGHLSVVRGPANRYWFCYRDEKFPRYWGYFCIDPMSFTSSGRIICGKPTLGPQSIGPSSH